MLQALEDQSYLCPSEFVENEDLKTPNATDDCFSDAITITQDLINVNGTDDMACGIKVKYTAVDMCGKNDTKTQSIVFTDREAPKAKDAGNATMDKTLRCGDNIPDPVVVTFLDKYVSWIFWRLSPTN